jgi:hypothetical protein
LRARRRFGSFVASAVFLLCLGHGAAACSDEESDPVGGRTPTGSDDAGADGTVDVPSDAATTDAVSTDAADAAHDAETDAGPKCSADGFCLTTLPSDAGTLTLTDVWADHDDAWAVSREGHILHWRSDAWTVAFDASVALHAVRRDHDGTLWAAGNAGSVFRHLAGGADSEWSSVTVPFGGDLTSICEGTVGATTPNLWFAGRDTVLHPSAIAGGEPTWESTSLGSIDIAKIWCSGTDVWAVGLDTRTYRTSLQRLVGTTWNTISGYPTTNFARPYSVVWAGGASDVWLANINQIVRGTGPDLGTWTTHDIGAWSYDSPEDWDTWGSGTNDVWFVGRHGRVYHWDGTDLEVVRTSIDGVVLSGNLHGIDGAGADQLWIVGDDVALHRQTGH